MKQINSKSCAASSDTTLNAQTPEGIDFTVYPAGIPARLCAYAIDSFICYIIIIVAEIIFRTLRSETGFWFILLLMFAVDWFFHVFFEVFCQGQSPGKKLLGLRVILHDGSPVNARSSFLRNALKFADTYLMLYQIALCSLLFSKGFRRIGDHAAGTIVVYTSVSRVQLQFRLLPTASKYEAVNPPRPLSFDEKQALISFARRYPLLGRARGSEIVKPWTETLRFTPYASDIAALTECDYALALAKKYHGGQ
jgi:uncharacterized RDD family membrane protein YckC